MIRIRKNVFETNSSSTHAFAFHKINKQDVDFENYEAVITPYLKDDELHWDNIQKFESVDEKLRYFYTLYCKYWNPEDELWYNQYGCKNFMDIVFSIFPKVKFVPCENKDDLVYMEDDNWVFETSDFKDSLDECLSSKNDIKRFFNEGVIYFGDRDYGGYRIVTPWEEIWELNSDIEKITHVSG